MLNIGEPKKMNKHFKMSDVDPRELIFLFDELQQALRPALNDHTNTSQVQKTTTLKKFYSLRQRQSDNFDD